MPEQSSSIIVLAGPTATGKTAAAIELATRLDGELIGADSVQVYRGFDIGSAKPTANELQGLPHHMLDVWDPDEPVDAVRYAGRADEAVEEALGRRHIPIVVGGTGLWLRALLHGLLSLPPVDTDLRHAIQHRCREHGPEALHAQLADVDPRAASRIHPRDALRITRALEVFEQTGEPLGELQAKHDLGSARYHAYFAVLEMPRQQLAARLRDRRRQMLASGWVEEVEQLLRRWGPHVRPMQSVGYKQVVDHLHGTAMDQTEQAIDKANLRYAKQQRTWFQKARGVTWRGSPEAFGSAETQASIERFLKSR